VRRRTMLEREKSDPAVSVRSPFKSAFRRSARQVEDHVHHLGRLGDRRAMIPNPTPTATPFNNTIAITT
jgi:hypothetical protein